MTWDLAEAKDRLSEVINLAMTEGPQTITGRREAVVVVSAEKYAELTGARRSFKEFLMSGPSLEGLDLERDRSPMRDVEL
jgi:prevent-host-death family protein